MPKPCTESFRTIKWAKRRRVSYSGGKKPEVGRGDPAGRRSVPQRAASQGAVAAGTQQEPALLMTQPAWPAVPAAVTVGTAPGGPAGSFPSLLTQELSTWVERNMRAISEAQTRDKQAPASPCRWRSSGRAARPQGRPGAPPVTARPLPAARQAPLSPKCPVPFHAQFPTRSPEK